MDNINTFLSIIILINLMLVVSSSSGHRRGDKGEVYYIYLLNITTIAWWVASTIFYRLSDSTTIDYFIKSMYAAATFITSSFYYFSFIFSANGKDYHIKLIHILLVNTLLNILLFMTPLIISGGEIGLATENVAHFGPLYAVYVAYILYYLSSSFIRLFIKYKKMKFGQTKSQIFYLFIGYTMAGLLAFVVDFIFPALGNFEYLWLGPVSAIFVAVTVTYAVARHNLFNVKVLTVEIFVFLLWVFSLIKISAIIHLQFLVLSLLIGILLIKSVKKQAEQHEENKRLVSELAAANFQLKEVDEIKSKFVSLARHQMASPLTAINAYASLLNDKDVDLDKIGLKSLQGIIDRFIVIVKDFLAISQIENEEIKYANDEFDLAQTLNDILCDRKFIIDHHNINIEMDIGEDDYKIKGDNAKLNTAIANVIENSIQYSKNSTIIVKLEKKNSKIILTISDEGVRSLPEISPVLLKKFSPDPFEATIMGNGLGVYISKRFIEAHGGTFEIRNDGRCQFMLTLPL